MREDSARRPETLPTSAQTSMHMQSPCPAITHHPTNAPLDSEQAGCSGSAPRYSFSQAGARTSCVGCPRPTMSIVAKSSPFPKPMKPASAPAPTVARDSNPNFSLLTCEPPGPSLDSSSHVVIRSQQPTCGMEHGRAHSKRFRRGRKSKVRRVYVCRVCGNGVPCSAQARGRR